jgi:hypothetical protein
MMNNNGKMTKILLFKSQHTHNRLVLPTFEHDGGSKSTAHAHDTADE